MIHQAFADTAARHRLLEGFLSRVARHPDGDAFALRGGMLIRHWFAELRRPARDVDLVCALPFDLEAMRERVQTMLATALDDGVDFEADRFRLDAIHLRSPHPGIRLFAVGRAVLPDGPPAFGEISVDTTFSMPVFPAAQRERLSLSRGEVTLRTCPPEMLVARKLQVLAQLGPHHWRPKDLSDVWWMLERFEPDLDQLAPAIERSFRGHDHAGLEELLSAPWWSEPRATTRWARYARQLPRAARRDRPAGLAAEVRDRLRPLLSNPSAAGGNLTRP